MADKGIIFSAPMVRALLDGRKTQTRRIIKPQPAKWEARVIDITTPFFCEHEQAWGQVETIWNRCSAMWEPEEEVWRPIKLPCAPGDRLYVREACRAEELLRPPQTRPSTRRERQVTGRTSVIVCDDLDGIDGIRYLADDQWVRIESTPEAGDRWSALFYYGQKAGARPAGLVGKGVPSIHMPRWASRLTLTVTAVRVQRLQEISEEDAIAEGIERIDDPRGTAWKSYETLPNGQPHPHASVPNASPLTSYAELWNSLHRKPGERWEDNPWIFAISFTCHRGNIDEAAHG